MTPSDTKTLIDALKDGNHLRLVEHEVAGLLAWLAGSTRSRVAASIQSCFGDAGRDGQATERAFQLLDHSLFDPQGLREDRAGVGPDRSQDERRRRYRLLLSAFHPDRYPDRASWLTERSQIITIAYSSFKAGPQAARGSSAARSSPSTSRPMPRQKPGRKSGQASGRMAVRPAPRRRLRPPTRWLKRIAAAIRQRFGGDEWLGHKIIGCFALVLVLPLLSVFLESKGQGTGFEEQGLDEAVAVVSASRGQSAAEGGLEGMGVEGERGKGSGLRVQGSGKEGSGGAADRDGGAGLGVQDSGGAGQMADSSTADGVVGEGGQSTMAAVRTADSPGGSEAVTLSDSAAVDGRAPRVSERRAVVQRAGANQSGPRAGLETSAGGRAGDGDSDALGVVAASTGTSARGDSGARLGLGSDGVQGPDGPIGKPAARAEVVEPDPPRARGRLVLGPLGTHQIGSFIQQYQLALEQAEFDQLVQLLGQAQANALRERFPGLFEAGQAHRVDLNVLQSQRDGDQWVVQLEQEIGAPDLDWQSGERSHRAEFRFRTDTDTPRFIALDF